MPIAQIRLILDTEKPAAAERVIKPVLAAINATHISSTPYAKGGIETVLEILLSADRWEGQVLDLIRVAQYLGYGWHITGSIDDEISMTSEKFRFTGIRWACIDASKDD